MTTELRNNDVLPGENVMSEEEARDCVNEVMQQHGLEFTLDAMIAYIRMFTDEACDARTEPPLPEDHRAWLLLVSGAEIAALAGAREAAKEAIVFAQQAYPPRKPTRA